MRDFKAKLVGDSPTFLSRFYEELRDGIAPGTKDSGEYAKRMLDSPQLYDQIVGVNLEINEGLLAGQTIPHVHMHVLPRRESDPVSFGAMTALERTFELCSRL